VATSWSVHARHGHGVCPCLSLCMLGSKPAASSPSAHLQAGWGEQQSKVIPASRQAVPGHP
jgi:hypothetical protein